MNRSAFYDPGGVLIRDINDLNVSEKTKSLLFELDSQIDMPVLIWADYPGERSDVGRMPTRHNQYMVAVSHQNEQCEFERIILHHMLRGVMETRRYPAVNGTPDFIKSITGTPDFQSSKNLCSHINAFATTEFCRNYFKPYGIGTSKNSVNKRIEGLKSFVRRIKIYDTNNPRVIDLVLDIASIAAVSREYSHIANHIADLINPPAISRLVKGKILRISRLIKDFRKDFDFKNGAEQLKHFYEELIDMFSLKDKFRIDYQYILRDDDIQINGIDRIYSFVPENISESEFYVQAVKQINFSLILIQEYLDLTEDSSLDFHVNLADGKLIQAFADGNKQDGYFITVTKPTLLDFREFSNDSKIPPGVLEMGIDDEEAFRKRLFKCLVFGVFFHEYGHIYNGDCDSPKRASKAQKESEADRFASEMFSKCSFFQYRFGNNSPQAEFGMLHNKCKLDSIAFSIAQKHLSDLRGMYEI